jgi:cobalt-zinc-cadmium efflux system protein
VTAHHPSAHQPHRHTANVEASRERRSLWIALSLTLGFAVIEAAAGWIAGSLALLSDAGHMITDSAALAIALLAQHVSQRPSAAFCCRALSSAEWWSPWRRRDW